MPSVENVDFRDSTYFRDLENGSQSINEFMIHLAVCHTILVMRNENGA